MSNHQREIAGISIGAAAIALILKGETNAAMILLVGMLSFFVGEKNGEKRAKEKA